MASDLRNLTVRLSLDRLNFDNGLSSVNRALNTLRGELNSTRSGMGGFESETERVRTRMDVLGRTVQVQEEKIRQLRSSYEASAQATGEDSRATQMYAAQVNRAVAELARMQGELTQTTEQLRRMESATNSFGQRMTTMGGKLQNAGMQIGLVFGSIAYAVGGVLKDAIKTGAEFESQIAKVGSKSNASAEDMKKLSDAAEKLAPLAGGASNAATAMDDLAAKGYSVNQILQAMPGILSAANASGEDLALTSDTITSALETFKMKATDTSHVADVLAKTANLTAAGMEDLQYTFKYAAAPAHALGISMEQLAAMTGIMANQGIKGEQAGTSLRGAMLRLVNPPKQARAALKDLHVQITDSSGKFRSFSDIIGDLNKSTAKMTNAQKTSALAHIFGTNAVSGMLAVISGGKPKIDKFTEALKNSDGASAKAAKRMQDNFAGSMKKLSGAMDAAKIGIEQALAPALRKIADIIQNVVVAFNKLSPGMKQFIAVSLAVVAVLSTIGAALGIFLAGFGAIASGIGAIGELIGGAAGAAELFGTALTVITGPIGIAVAAVAGLVAIFVVLYKKNDDFRNKVQEVWASIKNAFKVSLDFILNIVHKVMSAVTSFFNKELTQIKSFWKENGAAILRDLKVVFMEIQLVVTVVIGVIRTIFQTVWPIIVGVVQAAWALIKTIIGGAITAILGIIQTVLKLMQGDWKGAWQTIKDTVAKILGDMISNFKSINLRQIGKDIINGFLNGIESMSGAVANKVKSLANMIPLGIRKFLHINSPSRVTMELGGYVSEGLALGMSNNAQKVLAASNTLSKNAIPNINKNINPYTIQDMDGTLLGTSINNVGTNFNLEQFSRIVEKALERPVVLSVDGKEFARTNVKYFQDAIDTFTRQKNRLGGVL